jgi:hypothetical protein
LPHLRLGFERFSDMLPLAMRDPQPAGDIVGEQPTAYEPPTLVVIGNLKDLLAGNGSLGTDDTSCSTSTGLDPSC